MGRDAARREIAAALVAATLPLDEPRRVDTLVLHEFALRAARDERLADRLRVLDQQIQGELTAYLGTAPETAAAIVALSDGLAMRLLYGSQTPSQALAALRTGIAAVLAQPPAD